MAKVFNFTLSNEKEITVNPKDLDGFFDTFITEFLIPHYKESNDWNQTILKSVHEVENISTLCQKHGKKELTTQLLNQIEKRLSKDISELPKIDKIEILFENLDDLIEEITKIMDSDGDKQLKCLDLADVVEPLTLFELSELIYELIEKK